MRAFAVVLVMLGCAVRVCHAEEPAMRRMSVETYLDKCAGAWAGQMLGVCYGSPYEFVSNGKPIEEPLRPWTPDRIEEALQQDDCYVEMTFLKALEDHGIGISFEQAGQAFAASEYPLWHANKFGRNNVRNGIMPPLSGHPRYNRHADDIDFQIEADLFGIIAPGLPQASNDLCDIFGHIMNYGDGVYGGMFVAGMYAAAYFEDTDVHKVIRDGLACIPEASQYHQCISDVIQWHAESPADWLSVWHKIELKWQDNVDCGPKESFNIDAKLNGAYIVMGLLYGEGDLLKTAEIATRCGQDADCNPSNAVGVLGCMKGYKALGDLVAGIEPIKQRPFIHTAYSFETLIPACRRISEQLIVKAGGRVDGEGFDIPVQAPLPPETFEQWTRQVFDGSQGLSPLEVSKWNPAWRVVACGLDMGPGLMEEKSGTKNVLLIHPVSEQEPAVLAATLNVPGDGAPKLTLDVASDERGDFLLKVLVHGEVAHESVIDTHGAWTTVSVDLAKYAGQTVEVAIENHANGWSFEAAYLGTVNIQ